jgi:spore coat polysaccharide biosynthesis protein SpsF
MHSILTAPKSKLNHLGRIGVIVSARTGSRRLPAKALMPLSGMPMVIYLLERLKASRLSDEIILATTILDEDNKLANVVKKFGIQVFRGNHKNLIDRYTNAAKEYRFDTVVRITADCPFVDGVSLDYCLQTLENVSSFDLATTKGNFPVGIDFEIINFKSLFLLNQRTDLSEDDREHLTLFFYKNKQKFSIINIRPYFQFRDNDAFTIDTHEDYVKLKTIAERVGVFGSIEDICS